MNDAPNASPAPGQTAPSPSAAAAWQPIATAPADGTPFQAWVHRSNDPSDAWWEPWARLHRGGLQLAARLGPPSEDRHWDRLPGLLATHWMPVPTAPLPAPTRTEQR